MNLRAGDVLVEAAMKGMPQAFNQSYRQGEAQCVLGVLGYDFYYDPEKWLKLDQEYGLTEQWLTCPECGIARSHERYLLVHLNDRHRWDFLMFARKFGVKDAE
jgi:uncharacterized C2H2 Zn-finger protein